MILATQWLNGQQTKKLLNISDTELKSLRTENSVISLTLEGKLHYRLDTVLKQVDIEEVTTYLKENFNAPPALEEEIIKEEKEVSDCIAPWEEVEELNTVVAEPKLKVDFPECTGTKYLYHINKPWDESIVKTEDIPCFKYQEENKVFTRKSISGTLVNIALINTGKTNSLKLKAILVLRSNIDPSIAMVLTIYPLLFKPGQVLAVFLKNFTAGKTIKFENLGDVWNQHYRLIEDEVILNEWSEEKDYQERLTEKEILMLVADTAQKLKDLGMYDAFDFTTDRDFKNFVNLPLNENKNPLANAEL